MDIQQYHEALEFINYSVVEALGFKPAGASSFLIGISEIYRLGNISIAFTAGDEIFVTVSDEVRDIRRTTELLALLNKKAAG
ncbi:MULTISPECIES: hypothetical protein [Mucilaginibacter]|uniref:hypothetical protein n=1 Tax=Mucilaginibacter TaxID=423349 RepID=UPI001669AAE0|nr:hypothetical protein [Mucilaginibacter rubeus]GGB14347.1 hypothetical protein GCM10011500_32960 [Mucilaginibacter rubeus]